eukprot:scaffold28467_cov53-Phaeocystis_antarctica.AAC.5
MCMRASWLVSCRQTCSTPRSREQHTDAEVPTLSGVAAAKASMPDLHHRHWPCPSGVQPIGRLVLFHGTCVDPPFEPASHRRSP